MLKSWEPPTQQNSQDSATRVATGDHMGRMDPGDSSSLRCAEQTRSKWLMTHVCCSKIQNLIIGLGNLPLNHSAESAEPNRDINDWRVEVKKNTRSIKASIVWALGLLAQSHSSVQHISYDFIITSSSLHLFCIGTSLVTSLTFNETIPVGPHFNSSKVWQIKCQSWKDQTWVVQMCHHRHKNHKK